MSIMRARWLVLGAAVAMSACSAGKPPYQFASNEQNASRAPDAMHGSSGRHAADAVPGPTPARDGMDMAVPSTGDPDTDFLRGMIPHHEGAVDMARAVIADGTDPKVRAMAVEVIRTQQAEIAKMQTWLAERQAVKKGER